MTGGHLRIMVCVDDGISAVSTVRAARELVACSDSVVFLARVLEAEPCQPAGGSPARRPRR